MKFATLLSLFVSVSFGLTDYETTESFTWFTKLALMPENYLWNEKWGFITGSLSNGTVHRLIADSTSSPTNYTAEVFWSHPDLSGRGSLGVAIRNNKLYICHNNITSFANYYFNAVTKISDSNPAGLMVVDISGDDKSDFSLLYNFNFGDSMVEYNPALNNSEWNVRFANDLALDSNDNVYVTDTLSGVVYKIPSDATSNNDISIFAYHSDWTSAGSLGPNGIDTNYFSGSTSGEEFIMITVLYTGTVWKIPISGSTVPGDSVTQVSFNNFETLSAGLDGARFHKVNKTGIIYYYVCNNEANLVYRFTNGGDNWDSLTLDYVIYTRYYSPTAVAFNSSDVNDHVFIVTPYLFYYTTSKYPLQKVVFNDISSSSDSSDDSDSSDNELSIIGFALAGVFFIGMLIFAGCYCKVKNEANDPSNSNYRGF